MVLLHGTDKVNAKRVAEDLRCRIASLSLLPERPVTVWVGADERPVFLDQARWLAEAWHCDHVVTKGEHHFNVLDALTDPTSDLVRRLTSVV